jgi:uncharacterized membrane protein YdjX (TVP38/TMEM64 family)
VIQHLIDWLRSWGDLSLVSGTVLALVFFLASFLPFPRTFLYLGVGGLYGFVVAPILLASTTVGGVGAFLLARHVMAEPVQRRIIRYPYLWAIADAIDGESWRIVALLRFASPVPSSFQNYFFGVTRIRPWPYAMATFIFTIPQTVLYLYLGAVGRGILLEDSSSPLSRVIMVVGALCLVTVAYLIWRKARAALGTLPATFQR